MFLKAAILFLEVLLSFMTVKVTKLSLMLHDKWMHTSSKNHSKSECIVV